MFCVFVDVCCECYLRHKYYMIFCVVNNVEKIKYVFYVHADVTAINTTCGTHTITQYFALLLKT